MIDCKRLVILEDIVDADRSRIALRYSMEVLGPVPEGYL
jgi:hypothetical protein